jgi:mono/diheme cytochrome c family protein
MVASAEAERERGMKPIVLPFALCLLAAATADLPAQEVGDARQGRALAQTACAACHAVEKGRPSPHVDAPAFPAIANMRGMSARALTVALQTSHKTMPDLVLGDDETRNVIAYILSLRSE